MLGIVDTPIAAPVEMPSLRDGAPLAGLEAAFTALPSGLAEKLRRPDLLVVTTGQQPGLFTGPLYTIHKALSARAVALDLERRTGRPVVPVFWLAGDDHDYTEGSETHWLAADGSLVSVALDPRAPDAPMTPLWREPVPGRAAELLDQLAAAFPPGPAREETIGWLARHYRNGATLAGAYGSALAEVLGPLGIACFDPTHPAAKTAAAPHLVRAAGEAAALDQALARRATELSDLGQAADVRVGDGATLVFLDGAGGRDRLVIDGAGFRTRRGGVAVSGEDLAAIARAEPARLSANVLLRPVLESLLLPTVAYLAGPGELRYLRLAEALYRPLGAHRQLPIPRWSGVLVEPRVTRTVEKFGATLDELLAPDQSLEQRVIRGLAPADFDAAFADLRAAIEAGYARIAEVAKLIDPTLEKPAQSARGAAAGALGDLEKKLLQAQKRRQAELLTQLERARTAVRPGGAPQERMIGLPALAGRYGLHLLGPLADHVADWYRRALEPAGGAR